MPVHRTCQAYQWLTAVFISGDLMSQPLSSQNEILIPFTLIWTNNHGNPSELRFTGLLTTHDVPVTVCTSLFFRSAFFFFIDSYRGLAKLSLHALGSTKAFSLKKKMERKKRKNTGNVPDYTLWFYKMREYFFCSITALIVTLPMDSCSGKKKLSTSFLTK